MIWYDEHLVRALQETRLAGRRPRVSGSGGGRLRATP